MTWVIHNAATDSALANDQIYPLGIPLQHAPIETTCMAAAPEQDSKVGNQCKTVRWGANWCKAVRWGTIWCKTGRWDISARQ